jgi:DNA-binding transcriptional MerR regulator
VVNTAEPDVDLTIDDLARLAKLPVRTIREYQTMRLLPPPDRRGRVGVYGTAHVQRLMLIDRLQQRGYSLAGIKDLVDSWESGANLAALLGVDIGPGALDETPLRLTRAQLNFRLPSLTSTTLRRAIAVGLIHQDGARHFLVRSPALLALVAEGVNAGVSLSTMLDAIGAMREGIDTLAGVIADEVIDELWPAVASDGTAAIDSFLRRGRVLLLQGVVSTLADRLGDQLVERAQRHDRGDEVRASIDRVRVGAIVDGDGRLQHRRRR